MKFILAITCTLFLLSPLNAQEIGLNQIDEAIFDTISPFYEINSGEFYIEVHPEIDMDHMSQVTTYMNSKNEVVDSLITNYVMVYLINATDSVIEITKQDGSIIHTKQVQDSLGNWVAATSWIHSWCGNSYDFSLKIPPGSYYKWMMPESKGKCTMAARVELPIKGRNFYSNIFKANINPENIGRGGYKSFFELMEETK